MQIFISHSNNNMENTEAQNEDLLTQIQQNNSDDRIFFSLLEKAGIQGRYQTSLVIIMSVIGYLTGGLMLITPYLFYQDPYTCPTGYNGKDCRDYVCSLSPDQRLAFIPEPSMYTLGNKFGDYRCDSQKLKIDFTITMMYVGNVVGFLGLTLVGDLMGRKRLMLGNLLLACAGLTVVIFSVSLTMAAAGLFMVTCGIQNSFNVCFFFISETMTEHARQIFQVLIQLFYGLGVLINVLWYWSLGDWQLIFGICYFVPLVIVIIFFFFFVKDTPICLVMRNSSKKAYKALKYIAKLNKIKPFNLTRQQVAEVKISYELKMSSQNEKKKNFSILDLFKYKSLRLMTVFLIILQCTVIFQFYAPALMLDQFNLNLFINGMVIGVSELISYPICFYMISRTKRRVTAYGCFLITFMCSVALIFVWKQGEKQDSADIGGSIGVLILIFIFRFAISIEYTTFYVYFNELYPTQIRVLGTGLVSCMGGVMVTLAPIIIEQCIQGGFPVMIIFAVLSGVSGFLSSQLPQTLGVAPHDEIKELREKHVNIEQDKLKDLILKQKQEYPDSEVSDPSIKVLLNESVQEQIQ